MERLRLFGEKDIDLKDDFTKATKKMWSMVAVAVCLGLLIYILFYYVGREILDFYFKTSNYIRKTEEPFVNELQEYIDANSIKIGDCNRLENWIKEKHIMYFTVSKERELLYGLTYINGYMLAGDASESLHETWMYFMPIKFVDDDAEVFIYVGNTDKYYVVMSAVSALLSIVMSIIFVYFMIQREMQYLRQKLNAAEIKEKELIDSKNRLVQSMAHDLRTPLTGLIAFAEIVKIESTNGVSDLNHIDKIVSKANEIKELTDQIFDFSVLNNTKKVECGEIESFQSAFEDYLSDFCTIITSNAFEVQADDIVWPDCCVSINTNLVGRIFNNLISNICKYGKIRSTVSIRIFSEPNYVGIEIVNEVEINKSELDSTGIGLKNIEMMMNEMDGKFISLCDNNSFVAKIIFPIRT